MIEIIQAGPLTSVQDLGRVGFRAQGVAQSGATDALSLKIANILVGNSEDSAGIEWMFGSGKIKFLHDVWFALTGADSFAELNGRPAYSGWRYFARSGEVLVLKAPRRGLCTYLAVEGGLDIEQTLGSRATDLQSGFGGHSGRALQKGDRLALLDNNNEHPDSSVGVLLPMNDGIIHCLPGPEYEQFSSQAKQRFGQEFWQVKTESNRMGFRLEGKTLNREINGDLLSHGIVPGTIQVPPDGKPIIIGVDGQTTGGYPRIASVVNSDLWKVGQLRPGDDIIFRMITPEQAKKAYSEQQLYLKKLRIGLGIKGSM
ncbi:biotin-dependent carboxyltransferase family protein [Vibrio sp.]|nr:biotin-dependent carboxyltransferase family protein [Vibrio sp.]